LCEDVPPNTRRSPPDRLDIVGVSSVVLDGAGRILLIKTAKDGWELPGGQVEPGEDFITALTREVREETGCEIDVGRLTGVTSNTGVPRVTILTFLGRHIAGDPYPALGDGHGVIYRAYRRLPGDDPQREKYDMLRLHRGWTTGRQSPT